MNNKDKPRGSTVKRRNTFILNISFYRIKTKAMVCIVALLCQ